MVPPVSRCLERQRDRETTTRQIERERERDQQCLDVYRESERQRESILAITGLAHAVLHMLQLLQLDPSPRRPKTNLLVYFILHVTRCD
jgi:hypothetical protein